MLLDNDLICFAFSYNIYFEWNFSVLMKIDKQSGGGDFRGS